MVVSYLNIAICRFGRSEVETRGPETRFGFSKKAAGRSLQLQAIREARDFDGF